MKKETKIIITIGLSKEDMSTQLNKGEVINTITQELLYKGVLGFNLKEQVGFWKGDKENSLEVSFINTFNLKTRDLTLLIHNLKELLEQEAILLETQEVFYDFI